MDNKIQDDPNHWDTYAEYVSENPEYREFLMKQLDHACECDIADAKHIAYCKANNIKYY